MGGCICNAPLKTLLVFLCAEPRGGNFSFFDFVLDSLLSPASRVFASRAHNRNFYTFADIVFHSKVVKFKFEAL